MSLAHGFRRVLLVTDGDHGLEPSVRTAQMLAPHAEHVHWLCVAGPGPIPLRPCCANA
jgi:hypothetical protein